MEKNDKTVGTVDRLLRHGVSAAIEIDDTGIPFSELIEHPSRAEYARIRQVYRRRVGMLRDLAVVTFIHLLFVGVFAWSYFYRRDDLGEIHPTTVYGWVVLVGGLVLMSLLMLRLRTLVLAQRRITALGRALNALGPT